MAPLNELRGLAYLDKPGGMPGLCQVCSPGVQGVPNSLHMGYCQTLSIQQDKGALALATMIESTVEDLMNFPLI